MHQSIPTTYHLYRELIPAASGPGLGGKEALYLGGPGRAGAGSGRTWFSARPYFLCPPPGRRVHWATWPDSPASFAVPGVAVHVSRHTIVPDRLGFPAGRRRRGRRRLARHE